MLTLNLDLKEKSYPIYIGENLLNTKELLIKHIAGKQVMIVSNQIVAPLYLKKLKYLLSEFNVCEIILPDGEIYKTIKTVDLIYTALLNNKFDRNCTLIALGGGVVGDITGFAASSYQRGVNFIQIPTTLLAQVDSSVGGKTGVNHYLGKNMIGAFYQPKCVLIDINTLDSLDERQFSSGMAEVIKYGLLGNIEFYNYLDKNIIAIMQRDKTLIKNIIFNACKDKANIVAIDEFENNTRALLNLGHTFGHAIENLFGYGHYLHGEALSIGILMAARMSELEEYINNTTVNSIKNLLQKCHLPINISGKINANFFLNTMVLDKKSLAGNIRLILLKNVGKAFMSSNYSNNNLLQVIDEFCKDCK